MVDRISIESVRIALIVCTRNRASALLQCLSQIALQTMDPSAWELIVVDNGSTDHSAEIIYRFQAEAPFRVQYVSELVAGQGRARNAGIAATSAPIIAFTDDDCYPAQDFLQRMLEVFDDPTIGFAGGQILLHDPTDARLTIREDEIPLSYPPYAVIEPGVIQGANMGLRRKMLEQIGNFDTQLGPGTPFICDDVEICARASAAGWKGGYFPEPVVAHHHGRKPGREAKRQQMTYDYGRGAYFMKFVLRKDTRHRYLIAWIKRLFAFYRQGPGFSSRVRELLGAVQYLLHGRKS